MVQIFKNLLKSLQKPFFQKIFGKSSENFFDKNSIKCTFFPDFLTQNECDFLGGFPIWLNILKYASNHGRVKWPPES